MSTTYFINRRIQREFDTIEAMIVCYCRGVHGTDADLCSECRELRDYAAARLRRCPFGEQKPTCAGCPIHCYQPQRRDQVKAVNAKQAKPLALDYKLDEPTQWAGYNNIYARSDHYRYAQQGVPIAFFFTGLHGDYHQYSDEPEFIDYPHYARIANYIKEIAVEVANGPRPRLNGTKPAKPKVITP